MRAIAANLCRAVLALVFALSGTLKLLDPLGAGYKVREYAAALGLGHLMWDFVPVAVGAFLAATEFVVGIYLLFGIRRRVTLWFTLAFVLLMSVLVVVAGVPECGCLGEAWHLTAGQTLGKNALLALLAAVALTAPRRLWRLVSHRHQWTVSLYSIVFAFCLVCYSAYILPPVDFTPYRVGAHLDDTDLAYRPQGDALLVVCSRLEDADDGVMDQLNALCDWARTNGMEFVGLTSSEPDAIVEWQDMTGAEYDFEWEDETELRTMVRSNPGLVMVTDGRIAAKWSRFALPEVPQRQRDAHTPRDMAMLALWFAAPLALMALADRLWIMRRIRKRRPDKRKEL